MSGLILVDFFAIDIVKKKDKQIGRNFHKIAGEVVGKMFLETS